MSKNPVAEEGEKVVLDFSQLTESLKESNKALVSDIFEALHEKDKGGKGHLESGASSEKLVESLKKVMEDNWRLTEQWTVAIPMYTTKETSAGLRDYVWTQELLKNEPGDVANIPYVKDADFEQLAAVGNGFLAETTGLISSVTTTLYEAGLWSDVDYYLIERINQNLLDEINRMLANAAIRSEDWRIIERILAGTSTNFAGDIGRKTGAAYFYAAWVPQALRLLLSAGKRARPNECVLYMTASAYGALLEELCASQIIATADPKIITTGEIMEYLGVNIVVGGIRQGKKRTASATTGTTDICFLMRGKSAVALAPKRDLLIETDKQISTRKLRIAASHTFGVKVMDFKEIVRIWTSRAGA
jgi:hypothetical protein